MMRKMLVVALERIPGFSVHEADNGLAGMRALSEEQFDIVITDINMPIMDGLKLIKHIRQDKVHGRVPVVVVTTEGAPVDRTKALKLGANAYIIKPVQAHRVVEAITGLLGI